MKHLEFPIAVSMIVCLLILPVELLAHKVNIYAYTGDGLVYSESYFADGSRCKNCSVEVFDNKTGKNLLEGKTDEGGRFSFKIPQASSLKLLLRAGAGHQGVYYLVLGESGKTGSGEKAPEVARTQSKQPANSNIKTSHDKTSLLVQEKCLTSAEVEAIVNQAVEAKLQPVMSRLAAIQENTGKTGVAEVMGGIGYILGIMGIIMYLKSRKNSGK